MRNVSQKDIKRNWHLIDAKGKALGRVSTKITHLLLGKNKAYYTPYMDCGDNVVVINVSKVHLSGNKETQKSYYRHSGYPGGLKVKTANQLREQKPEEMLRHAVVRMLPKNRLARQMVKKLYIFKESDHPYKNKFSS